MRWIVAMGVVVAAIAAPSATGGGPGVWTQTSSGQQQNIDEVGLARTGDGVLHIVWLRQNGSNEDLVHSAVSPSGATVGGPVPIVSGWAGVTNASLVVGGDGTLRVLFSGLRSADITDPYASGTVYSATAPAAGTSWALAGEGAAHSSAYASDLVGAAVAGDGSIVTDWATTFGTQVHVGLRRPRRRTARPARSTRPGTRTRATARAPTRSGSRLRSARSSRHRAR
jgi:hypothetical protein